MSVLGALVAPLLALQYIGGYILRLALHIPFMAMAALVALLPIGAIMVGLCLCIYFLLENPVLGKFGVIADLAPMFLFNVRISKLCFSSSFFLLYPSFNG